MSSKNANNRDEEKVRVLAVDIVPIAEKGTLFTFQHGYYVSHDETLVVKSNHETGKYFKPIDDEHNDQKSVQLQS